MELEGIQFRGEPLKIGRPANYNPQLLPAELRATTAPKLNTSDLGIVSNFVPNGPNKLYCGGIPYSLSDDQVKELLNTYGPLKAFFLAQDQNTGLSKGYCFFQYEDATVSEDAIKGLNGIKIGDRQLAVRRHTPSQNENTLTNAMNPMQAMDAAERAATMIKSLEHMPNMGVLPNNIKATTNNPIAGLLATNQQNTNGLGSNLKNLAITDGHDSSTDNAPTKILCLLQMVTKQDLIDEEEYNEIREDIEIECREHGIVKSLTIPRPLKDNTLIPGVGKVFVEFDTIEACTKAKQALEGRTFDDHTVIGTYFDETKYHNKQF